MRVIPYVAASGKISIRPYQSGARIRNHPMAIKMRNCLRAARGRSLTERKNALRTCNK